MKTFIFIFFLLSVVINSFGQSHTKLDPLAAKYFTKSQIDTMSQNYIKVQNYIVRYSWNIYGRYDKERKQIIAFSRDTIDIRPFLKARKKDKPKRIYDVYPGLLIELDSQNSVEFHIKKILAGEE